jgi:cytochrome c oxidase accessory protein FixG
MGREESPNLNKLAIIDEHGWRRKVQPADVTGRFTKSRRAFRWAALALGVFLPWAQINDRPAVLIDIADRKFFLLWGAFNAQDVPLFFFIISGIGFGLIVTSALFGRVWCGWACPQTVVLEGIFRPIERLIEGPASHRKRLDEGPWNLTKIWKKALKWSVYAAICVFLAHTFLAYFVGGNRLAEMVLLDPRENWTIFIWASALSALFLFVMSWFREQVCLIICPYGRLQSVLQDDDTWVIAYDKNRGEPRGKAKDPNAADCVDCKRCIAVCPTGIDIRNGLQMECIGCAQCIDACNDIMVQLERPEGLIRYETERGLSKGKHKFIRLRVIYYAIAGLIGLGVATGFGLSRVDLEANILRVQGAPYEVIGDEVQNRSMIHIVNKNETDRLVEVSATAPEGVQVLLPIPRIELRALTDVRAPIIINAPRTLPPKQRIEIQVKVDGKVMHRLPLQILVDGGGK